MAVDLWLLADGSTKFRTLKWVTQQAMIIALLFVQ